MRISQEEVWYDLELKITCHYLFLNACYTNRLVNVMLNICWVGERIGKNSLSELLCKLEEEWTRSGEGVCLFSHNTLKLEKFLWP